MFLKKVRFRFLRVFSKKERMNSQEIFDFQFQETIDHFKSNNADIVMSFNGELNDEKINEFSFAVEAKMMEAGEKKGLVKRIFSILIEALQNMHIHGEKDSGARQFTFVVVARGSDAYFITFANLIQEVNKARVIERIEYINTLNKEQLKEHYMNVLTDGEMSKKGGAGLGFITIGMKSKNKMSYQFHPVGDGLNVFVLHSFANLKESEG